MNRFPDINNSRTFPLDTSNLTPILQGFVSELLYMVVDTGNRNERWFNIPGTSVKFSINLETVVTQSYSRLYRELENAALTIAANTDKQLIVFDLPDDCILGEYYLVFAQGEDSEPVLEPILKETVLQYRPNLLKTDSTAKDFNRGSKLAKQLKSTAIEKRETKKEKRCKPKGFG